MADRGYDIWMLNTRGNRYSRNHTTLDPDVDNEFWNFSFHEEREDQIASIDYILSNTGQSQLSLIAFSLSTNTLFAALSDASLNEWFSERVNIIM